MLWTLVKRIFHQKSPKDKTTTESLSRLQNVILNTLNFNEVVQNSVFKELGYLDLGYRIVVLTLINEEDNALERIAISQTEEAQRALAASPVPFRQIIIPLDEAENTSVKAIKSNSIAITQNWYDLFRPVYTPEEAESLREIIGIKTSMVYPVTVKGKTIGALIFSMVKEPSDISTPEKDLLVGFTNLVGLAVQNALLYTSLEATSSQLQHANEKLQQLDKLKDDFVSIASHELRTPMTAIKSYVWMAINRSDIPLSEKLKKYLTRTLLSTDRLIDLVNDMLNVSRIEAGRIEITPTVFDLQTLADDVMSEVAPKVSERGIQLQSIKSAVPKVFADPDKVHQVLLNLLGNALKFTPEGGVITISFFTDGQVVETSVKDTGVGITTDDLSRLFQKFGRLDNSYVAAATAGGTGLGLYICRSLVELMRGKIRASSEGEGKGATFTFSLPVATPAVVAEAAKYSHTPTGEAKHLEPVAI